MSDGTFNVIIFQDINDYNWFCGISLSTLWLAYAFDFYEDDILWPINAGNQLITYS